MSTGFILDLHFSMVYFQSVDLVISSLSSENVYTAHLRFSC